MHECSAGVHDFTYSAAAVPSYLHVGTYNALHITWTALLPLPGRHSYCSAADERPLLILSSKSLRSRHRRFCRLAIHRVLVADGQQHIPLGWTFVLVHKPNADVLNLCCSICAIFEIS